MKTSGKESRAPSDDIDRYRMMTLQVSRDEFIDDVLGDCSHLYEHPYRATCDIRLRPVQQRKFRQLIAAQEEPDVAHARYAAQLEALVRVVRAPGTSGDLPSLSLALSQLINSANLLGIAGWHVNWEQNAQWAFKYSMFGISGDSVVPRYEMSSYRVTLEERLEILGTLTFLMQRRIGDKILEPEQLAFTRSAEDSHGDVMLSLTDGPGRRYASTWFESGGEGKFFRLLSD